MFLLQLAIAIRMRNGVQLDAVSRCNIAIDVVLVLSPKCSSYFDDRLVQLQISSDCELPRIAIPQIDTD